MHTDIPVLGIRARRYLEFVMHGQTYNLPSSVRIITALPLVPDSTVW